MSQIDSTEQPPWDFFRTTPESIMDRPPLCSSLQSLESSFILISLSRFPHALVTCASSIESSMKSALGKSPNSRINAKDLYAEALDHYAGLESFDGHDLRAFLSRRNHIVHYGFSPRDDETTATLLLKTGFPFLKACYLEFFCFELVEGLALEFGENFKIALDVYQRAKALPRFRFSQCFSAFGHLILWSLRESIMAEWENEAATRAESYGLEFEICNKKKDAFERIFGATWTFDCPICRSVDTFVCELDEERLATHTITLKRAACGHCDLVVDEMPFLADALVGSEIGTKRTDILQGYGLLTNND